MARRFDSIVQEALSRGVAIHFVYLESLGELPDQPRMLRACLHLVVRRYPGLQLQISGRSRVLAQLALENGKYLILDEARIPVRAIHAAPVGAMRLILRRGELGAMLLQPPL